MKTSPQLQHADDSSKHACSPHEWKARLYRFWIAQVDALPLRVFEVAFTLVFLAVTAHHFLSWREWLTDWGFRPTANEYLALGYPEPLPTLQPWMVPIFALLTFGAGIAIVMNWHRRFALWVTLACAVYAQGVDYLSAFAYNKIFIAVYALLATGPGIHRTEDGRAVVSAALPRILQATLVTIYLAAGIAKTVNGDWLKHSDTLWSQMQGFHRNELAALLLRTLPKWAWSILQYCALAFECFAPLLFLVRKLRPVAIIYGITLHLMIAALMSGLIFFSSQMWTFYALWFTAEQWRWVGSLLDMGWERVRGRGGSVHSLSPE